MAAVPGLADARRAAVRGGRTAAQRGSALPAGAIGSALPAVKPLWSQRVAEAFGVCSHPNFGQTVYASTNSWMEALAATGATYFRGLYSHRLSATQTTLSGARKHGIKWGMTICPEDWGISDLELIARVQHIAANAADMCLYVEGVNEPNHERDGSAPPQDWVRRTVRVQKLIWDAVKGNPRLDHVKIIGPSLHAVAATEADYRALGDAGLTKYMDYAGLHRYHGGRYPDHLIDERLAWVKRHWDAKPTWITETGYTNATGSLSGHPPVPEDVSAVYAPAAVLEAVDRECKVAWYELLDDPDSWRKADIESNFGMYSVGSRDASSWRPKPIVGVMKSFLKELQDEGKAYDPPEMGLRVTSDADDVRSTLVAKRDGTATLYVRRATDCWDPQRQQPIRVAEVPVRIETDNGATRVLVNHEVQAVAV